MRLMGLEVHRAVPDSARLEWFLGMARPDITVDVGANEGQFLAELRAANFDGPVVLVEPIPQLADSLRGPGRTVHAVAAGDTDGTVQMVVTRDSRLSSIHQLNDFADRVWKDDDPDRVDVVDRIDVPQRRLDGLLADVPGRLFVKVDTQGHDLAALRGLSGVLDRVVAIQTELAFQNIYDGAPLVGEHLDAVNAMGFGLVDIAPIFRSDDGALIEADGLFIRRAT